jgi:hypothetical protein
MATVNPYNSKTNPTEWAQWMADNIDLSKMNDNEITNKINENTARLGNWWTGENSWLGQRNEYGQQNYNTFQRLLNERLNKELGLRTNAKQAQALSKNLAGTTTESNILSTASQNLTNALGNAGLYGQSSSVTKPQAKPTTLYPTSYGTTRRT